MDAAVAETARRRVKRASGILADAVRELAALADGTEAVGTVCVHDRASAEQAAHLVSVGVARHGVVDVIVVARSTPTTAANAAKENHHANGTREGSASP